MARRSYVPLRPSSVFGAHRMELDPVHESVLGDRRERDKLDGIELDQIRPDPVAAPSLACGRFHSRTDSVISPAMT
jgi:hypothetical protein